MDSFLLASAATLFYAPDKDQTVRAFISTYIDEHIDEDWDVLQFEFNQGELQYYRKTIEPGNEVARVVMGILFFMRNRYGEEKCVHPIVKQLVQSKYSIGVMFDPKIADVDNDDRIQFLLETLRICDGVMFDGLTLYNAQLEMITSP